MKQKRDIITWFYPLFIGVIAFNILRVITDLTRNDMFWQGDKQTHIASLIFSILFCYIMDMVWRRRFKKPDKGRTALKEYLFIFAELFIFFSLYLGSGTLVGVVHANDDLLNWFLIFISYIPLLMLYYAFIRSNDMNQKYQENILLLEKIKVSQYQTELKYLKSQYHPHFLFNALNTIYFLVNTENKPAKEAIELLSGLLRYQLYDINQKVSLEKEVDYLRSYIKFQQLRTSKRLKLELSLEAGPGNEEIHPLLFMPLVENAFKYVGGDYQMEIRLKNEKNKIHFFTCNSVSGRRNNKDEKNNGIGISNLRRQLELLYPGKHTLEIKKAKDSFYTRLIIEK